MKTEEEIREKLKVCKLGMMIIKKEDEEKLKAVTEMLEWVLE